MLKIENALSNRYACVMLLCLITPTILPFWGSSNKNHNVSKLSEEEVLQRLQLKCEKIIDKKIEKIEKKRSVLLEKAAQDQEIQSFFDLLQTIKKQYQESSLALSICHTKNVMELINQLKEYNYGLAQPQLLKKVDDVYNSEIIQNQQKLSSFLRKERVHLLELQDEGIVIQTLYRYIDDIEKELLQEHALLQLEFLSKTLSQDTIDAHKKYLEHPLMQELQTLCNTLWDLYIDKEIIYLKDKEFKKLLHTEKVNRDDLFNLFKKDQNQLKKFEQTYFLTDSDLLNYFLEQA